MQPNAPVPPSNQPPAISPAGASKIQHSRPGIGMGASAQPGASPGISSAPAAGAARPAEASVALSSTGPENTTGAAAPSPLPGTAGSKIQMFGREKRHEDKWSRTPNTTGGGAIHVKTFSCKLTEDALTYMDQAINEWLDAHPQYEVKFVASSIGVMTGKLKEPAMICQVWV